MRVAPAVVPALLVLAACASAISVRSEAQPGATFDGLRTFAWVPTRLSADATPDLQSTLATVQETAVAELQSRGYALAPAGTAPDFQVTGWIGVSQKESVAYVDNGFGGFSSTGGGATTATVTAVRTSYEEGTLVLDVVRGGTGAAMWRGTATGTVDRTRAPGERRARLVQAVRDTLAEFPPK